jgi:MFS family permease
MCLLMLLAVDEEQRPYGPAGACLPECPMTSTAAERRVEVCPPASERPRYGLLAGLAPGLLPAELDRSIFATALPAVVAELGGLAGLALINTSYVLAGAVAMLLIGPLGDRLGRRPGIRFGPAWRSSPARCSAAWRRRCRCWLLRGSFGARAGAGCWC